MFRTASLFRLTALSVSAGILWLLSGQAAYAACANPAGAAGDMIYNTDFNTVQFCNDTNWISVAGSGGGGGSASAAGSAGGVQFAGASNVFAADATTFFWDNTNKRLGIGTAAPATTLHLKAGSGSSTTLTTDYALNSGYAESLIRDEAGNNKWATGVAGDSHGTTALQNAYYIYQYKDKADANVNTYRMVIDNSGNVGVGTNAPAATAALDITSTTKGFLPPRMTTAQRDAITTPATALMIFNTTTGQLEFWNGTSWTGVGSMTAGTIAAFAATSCPSGWTEYTPARGRFLRGIDPSGSTTVDPRGTVAPGTQQADALQGHYHTGSQYNWSGGGSGATSGIYGTGNGVVTAGAGGLSVTGAITDGTNGTPRTAGETRPVNVAVIYCQYSGSGGGGGSASASGAAGTIQFAGASNVFEGDNGNFFWDNTNKRLGIGTATPYVKLSLLGSAQVGIDGTDTGNSAVMSLISLNGQNAGAGSGTAKGWSLYARSNAFSTASLQNDFGLSYWNGTVWAEAMYVDSLTAAATFTNNVTATAFLYSSDLRLKENVTKIESALAKLTSINGVTFTFKDGDDKREHLGVIAQEVEKVFPQAVVTGDDGMKKVDYPALIGPMIEAIKELKTENDALRARIEKLEAK